MERCAGGGQRTEFRVRNRTATGTGWAGAVGARRGGGVLPLRSQSLARSSGCAGRYRPRVRSAPAARARLSPIPWYGKFILRFSTLWKNNSTVWKIWGGRGGGGGIFFHGVEKMFPQYGKVLWGNGLRGGSGAGGGYWRSWVMAWWRAGWWVGVRWYRSWRAAGGVYWA